MENQIYIDSLRLFAEYVSDNIDDEDLINKSINRTYVSKYHFYRLFKAVTGISINRYITHRRLINVMSEIMNNKKTLTAAVNSGFNSNEVMTRNFKKEFSITPTVFRNMSFEEQEKLYNRHNKVVELDFSFLELDISNKKGSVFNNYSIKDIESFQLIGKSRISNDSMVDTIPDFVNRVAESINKVTDIKEDALYRICSDVDTTKELPTFKEFVGVPVSHNAPIPEGFELLELEPCKVIQFKHKGPLYHDENTPVVDTYELIYKYRLPSLNITVTDKYFIERYGEDFFGSHNPESIIRIMMTIK